MAELGQIRAVETDLRKEWETTGTRRRARRRISMLLTISEERGKSVDGGKLVTDTYPFQPKRFGQTEGQPSPW